MPRLEFSRKIRRAIIERAKGCCELCNAWLKPGEAEIDHLIPAELGGDGTVANGRLLCRLCHKAKTAKDIRGIRKADRQRDRHTGAMPPAKVKIPTRPKRAKVQRDQIPMPKRSSLYQQGKEV